MVNIEGSLRYPMESEDWHITILIGGVLSIFSFLLIPIVFVYGYIIQVIQARYEDEPEPPEFDDWGEILSDGFQAVIIGIVYMFIPGVVGAVTTGGAMFAFFTGSRAGMAAGLAGLLGGFLVTFILSLVFGYVGVAAILNFAENGDLGAAFEFGTIKEIVLTEEYAIAWLAAVVVFIGVSIISSVLNVIPFLGAIVTAFIFFYAQMVAAYLWADGFTAATTQVSGMETGTTADPSG